VAGDVETADRLGDLVRFYEIIDSLSEKIGGPRILADCTGRMGWPERGVYFFQEHVEPTLTAPWTCEDRGWEPQGLHIPSARRHRTVCDPRDDSADLGTGQFCPKVRSGERTATGRTREQNHCPDAVPVARRSRPAGAREPARLHRAQCHCPAQQLQQTRARCPVVFLALQPGEGTQFRAMEPESCR